LAKVQGSSDLIASTKAVIGTVPQESLNIPVTDRA
jgi:hypothetical protein